MAEGISLAIRNCARCGEDHPTLIFSPFTRPVRHADLEGVLWTYWTACPTNDEPILLRVEQDDSYHLADV